MTRAHESFAFLEGRLDRYPAELGSSGPALDASGGWSQGFELRLPIFVGGVPKLPEDASSSQVGRLELSCRREGQRSILEVERSVVHGRQLQHVQRATLRCAADRLSSLESWETESSMSGSRVPLETRSEGTLEQWRAAHAVDADAPAALTSSWGLMDAVQRWDPDEESVPAGFDLLDDLEIWCPGQQLERLPRTTLSIGGRRTELHGYRHFGHALTPRVYWLNPAGRLLFVAEALWALVPGETR